MYKLYMEYNDERELFGTYATDQEARKAIQMYLTDTGFTSYYWNCYMLPEDDELAGGTHVDYGSWSRFFIIFNDGSQTKEKEINNDSI